MEPSVNPISSLGLAVTHLNASVGAVLTAEQLAQALRAGSVDALHDEPTAAALVAYLFVELNPRLIALCAFEADTDVAHAHQLYQEGLLHAMPRVAAWENAIQYLL
jgi:ABC-type amino acid transport substrate-binding protein